MDGFLNELMPKLFGYLELADLINCRLVNKRFKHFADTAKIEEIVVASKLPNDQKKCLFITKAMVDIEKSAISPASFNGCRFVFRKLNCHLKRLILNFKEKLLLNMAIFDKTPIEQLDVTCHRLGSNQAVELPHLKMLELMFANEDMEECTFFVRAPNLTKLKTNDLEAIHLGSPEALRYLDTTGVQETYELETYQSVEVLRVRFFDREILTSFERLKRLEIISGPEANSRQTCRSLRYLLKQSRVLKRPDFRLFYSGVPIMNGTELDELPVRLNLQLANYRLLSDDLDFATEMDYTYLMGHFEELPANFFSTFFNIQKITTSAPVNRDQFMSFCRSCPYLIDLTLVNSSLNLSLAELPDFCDLRRLKVEETLYIDAKPDFILRFKRLKSFEWFAHSSSSFFSLAILAFKRLPELDYFRKQTPAEVLDIFKCDKNSYDFEHTRHEIETNECGITLEELVQACVKAKYYKLDYTSCVKEILYLSKFYKMDSE